MSNLIKGEFEKKDSNGNKLNEVDLFIENMEREQESALVTFAFTLITIVGFILFLVL